MTREDEFIGRLEAYLDEYQGPTPLPGAVRDAIRGEIPRTRQVGSLPGLLRHLNLSLPLPASARYGLLAAVVVAAAVLGASFVYRNGAGPPDQQPTPTAIPSPLGPIDEGWAMYTSAQYGYAVGHPQDWTVDPAERAWDFDTDAADPLSPAIDDFTSPSGDVRVSVWSVPLGTFVDDSEWGIDLEAFIAEYCLKSGSASCDGILDGAVPLCREMRDCHPGILIGVAPPFDRDVQAFFSGPDSNEVITVVTAWRTETDPSVAQYGGARRLIQGFLHTMCVAPPDPQGPFPCG